MMDSQHSASLINRRQLLDWAAAGFGCASLSLMKCRATAADAEEAGDAGVLLVENRDRQLFRVRLAVDVKGNVDVPVNPLVSRERQAQIPITSQAVFDYEERYRWPKGTDSRSEVLGVERYYHEAASEGTLNKTPFAIELRPEVRMTRVRRDMLPEQIACPGGHFTHEELGLLRTPASAVSLGDLLPKTAVRPGNRYHVANHVLCSMLNLSSVDDGDWELEVDGIDADVARIKIRGRVDGSVEGVPTLIRLAGKLAFDRKESVVHWLTLAVHETRDVGKSEPGFDVSATIRMIRKPLDKPVRLAAKPPAWSLTEPVDPSRWLVQIRSDHLNVAATVDRRWKMMSDVPGSAMLRMIDHETSLGQCNLRPLVKLPEGRQWTLEAFEQDIRKTMGNQLSQLVQAKQRLSPRGIRVLELKAIGREQGVDVRWIFQHFSDGDGRRLLATYIADADQFKRLAGSEVQFADTLQFITPPTGGGPTAKLGDVTKVDSDPATKIAKRPQATQRNRTERKVVEANADSPSASDRK